MNLHVSGGSDTNTHQLLPHPPNKHRPQQQYTPNTSTARPTARFISPSRPVVKIYPVEICRLAPSRNWAPTPTNFGVILPSCLDFIPAKQIKTVPSCPVLIVSYWCDKPCKFPQCPQLRYPVLHVRCLWCIII